MCWGNPAAMFADAWQEMPGETKEKFVSDFSHFCAYSGLRLQDKGYSWAKWAFWSAGDYNGRKE